MLTLVYTQQRSNIQVLVRRPCAPVLDHWLQFEHVRGSSNLEYVRIMLTYHIQVDIHQRLWVVVVCGRVFMARYVLAGPQPCELVDVKVDLTYKYNTVTRSGTFFRATQSLKIVSSNLVMCSCWHESYQMADS